MTRRDGVRNADRVILPAKHALIDNSFLDFLSEIQEIHITRIAFPPHRSNANMRCRLHCLLVWHTSCVEHSLLSSEQASLTC